MDADNAPVKLRRVDSNMSRPAHRCVMKRACNGTPSARRLHELAQRTAQASRALKRETSPGCYRPWRASSLR
eukprot:3826373-Prymnesium_polylepis.1